MEIAVVILAVLVAGAFIGWLRAQRSAGLARDESEELHREHAAAQNEAEVELATLRTTLQERERELSARNEEHEQASGALRDAQAAREQAATELAEAKAELGERSNALGVALQERNEARHEREAARRELATVNAELAEVRAELAEAKAELGERSSALAVALQERNEARHEREAARRELATVKAELAEAKAELEERSSALAVALQERNEARHEREAARRELATVKAELAEVRADHDARQQEIEKARAELETRFKGIAAEVAKSSNEEFRKQAAAQFKQQTELASAEHETRRQAVDNLVKPVGETLEQLQKRVGEIEKARENAYGRVEELIQTTHVQVGQLREATSGLRSALSSPQQRGRWGELTLERVLETAGMREHVDYDRQAQTSTEDGAVRPDAVIRLPRGLTVPVDAKTPLEAYLRAHEADDEAEQRNALDQHASSLMNHARSLSAKNYSGAIEGKSPEFVVLFVPTETILDAAMVAQPNIWEDAWSQHRVLIASPGLLIALLRTVGVAWQQEDIQRNAQEIADAAGELYGRLATYAGHITRVGRSLDSTVKAYNQSVGSFQSRVLAQARRMEELGAVEESRRIEEPEPVESEVRVLQAPELPGESE